MGNHSDLIARVLAQRDAVKAGSGQSMPLSLKLTGSTGEPEELAERIGDVLGRPVKVTVVAEQARSTEVGSIMTMDESIQKFYDEASKRGGKTGD